MDDDLLIRPSEGKQYNKYWKENEKDSVNRCHQNDCDPDAGVTDGDTGKGTEIEQLNPVREDQQMEIETQRTPAEEEKDIDGESKDGLRPGVAAEEETDNAGREEEGEEAREAVAAPAPLAPSRMEKEMHELTHTPYRSWCPHCVRMRGRNTAHKKKVHKEKSWVPRISFDYFFFSQEDEQANKNPMIVMVDEETGEHTQEAFPKKESVKTGR